MWPVIIVFVLVLGYYYIDNDIESKHKFKKAQGWSAYFMVALKGSEFLMFGVAMTLGIEILLYLCMWLFNLLFVWGDMSDFTFANDFNNTEVKSFNLFTLITVFFTFAVAISQTAEARKRKDSSELSQKVILKICYKDTIKKLKLEAFEREIQLMVTLKSRKVYVGIADIEKITNIDTFSDEFISIIPLSSGYRDSETLDYIKTKDYSLIYKENNILEDESDGNILSFRQFRHIINMSEVESVSLFDPNIYESFKSHQQLNS